MSVQMARHHGALNAAEVEDKAVTVRPSASANFYVDSTDKSSNQGSGDFSIDKKQSLFNGFFNRIASAEIVMDWGIPNVASWWGNNTITVTNATSTVEITATIPDGFYTAVQALEAVATAVNAAALALADPLRLAVDFDGLDVKLVSNAIPFYVVWIPFAPTNDPPYALARQLFSSAQLAGVAVANTEIILASPRLLGTTYVDIVSPQLTYNQDLKDATTDAFSRDVLYRWYLADDNVPLPREKMMLTYAATTAPAVQVLTETNIPVLQGYNPFVIRRALPYPKQVKWNADQPIGQVSFQCYDDRGRLISTSNFPWSGTTGFGGANFQFQMSMLLSEN